MKILPKRHAASSEGLLQRVSAAGTQRTVVDRIKRDVIGGERLNGYFGAFFGGLSSSFEFAVDGNVGVLVEAGIGLHAGFGFGSAPENREIMVQEADVPVDGGEGVVVLEGVRLSLGFLNEFTVRHAGRRPGLGEMVSIELEKLSSATRNTADDDVLVIVAAFLVGTHGAI